MAHSRGPSLALLRPLPQVRKRALPHRSAFLCRCTHTSLLARPLSTMTRWRSHFGRIGCSGRGRQRARNILPQWQVRLLPEATLHTQKPHYTPLSSLPNHSTASPPCPIIQLLPQNSGAADEGSPFFRRRIHQWDARGCSRMLPAALRGRRGAGRAGRRVG